jgi:hypothetical protein
MRDLQRMERLWNEMAIAGQMLDDFEDLDEDWRADRFNSVARIMLGKDLPALARKGRALAAVKQSLAAGGTDRIAQMVLERIDRAEEALKPIGGKSPYAELRRYRRSVERMRQIMHRESVRLFFSGA